VKVMGLIKHVPRSHKCSLPERYNMGHGSLWRCDKCGWLWKFYGDGYDGHWNFPLILTLWYWLKEKRRWK